MTILSTLSMRTKLLLAFLSVLSLSALLIYFGIRSIHTITFLKSTNEKLETLELNLAVQELAAKEFIYEGYKTQSFQQEGTSSQIEHFQKSQAATREILAFLNLHAQEYHESWEKLRTIQVNIAAEFDSLKSLLKTRSGLGESRPSNLALIPLKLDRKTYGVLEIASFGNLEEQKIFFLEKASETITLLIFNRKNSEATEKLLAEAKQKAEILQQHEEAMRQNMEEVTVMREQLKRQSEKQTRALTY